MVGETITWQGRLYLLRGVDPRGLKGRSAELEDTETGDAIRVPLRALLREIESED